MLSKNIDESKINSEEWRNRVDLAAAYRWADREGLSEGVCNHFTVASPCNTKFLVIPHGVHWSKITASQLLMVSKDGENRCSESFCA